MQSLDSVRGSSRSFQAASQEDIDIFRDQKKNMDLFLGRLSEEETKINWYVNYSRLRICQIPLEQTRFQA